MTRNTRMTNDYGISKELWSKLCKCGGQAVIESDELSFVSPFPLPPSVPAALLIRFLFPDFSINSSAFLPFFVCGSWKIGIWKHLLKKNYLTYKIVFCIPYYKYLIRITWFNINSIYFLLAVVENSWTNKRKVGHLGALWL